MNKTTRPQSESISNPQGSSHGSQDEQEHYLHDRGGADTENLVTFNLA